MLNRIPGQSSPSQLLVPLQCLVRCGTRKNPNIPPFLSNLFLLVLLLYPELASLLEAREVRELLVFALCGLLTPSPRLLSLPKLPPPSPPLCLLVVTEELKSESES